MIGEKLVGILSLASMILREHLENGGKTELLGVTYTKDGPLPNRKVLARDIRLCCEVLTALVGSASDADLKTLEEIVSRLRLEITELNGSP